MEGLFKTLVVGVAASAALLAGLADAAQAKYREVEVKNGGVIRGLATWKGKIPMLPPIAVFKHMDKCGQTVTNPALIVDKVSKGVKFVFVHLKDEIPEGKPLPPKKINRNHPQVLHAGKDVEQRPDSALCNFEEHVFPFIRTRAIGMYNMEDVLHNPHGFGKNGQTLFNVALPDRNRITKKTFRRVKGLNRFQCDTHVHMNAWMFGMDHPYFAVTDNKGRYEIADIPPGRYTVEAWHEGYNITEFASDNRPTYDEPHVITESVEVKGGETIKLNFEYPVRDVTVEHRMAERKVAGH